MQNNSSDSLGRFMRKGQLDIRIPDPDDDLCAENNASLTASHVQEEKTSVSSPLAPAAVVSSGADDAAAARAGGETESAGDATRTPAASKNAFSALMSSSKASKTTAVNDGASDTPSRDLFPVASEEATGKGRLRGRKCAGGEDASSASGAGPMEAASRSCVVEKTKGKGASRKKTGAKEPESSEDGDAEAGLSDGGEEPAQA